jgi:hypothetical protein
VINTTSPATSRQMNVTRKNRGTPGFRLAVRHLIRRKKGQRVQLR